MKVNDNLPLVQAFTCGRLVLLRLGVIRNTSILSGFRSGSEGSCYKHAAHVIVRAPHNVNVITRGILSDPYSLYGFTYVCYLIRILFRDYNATIQQC